MKHKATLVLLLLFCILLPALAQDKPAALPPPPPPPQQKPSDDKDEVVKITTNLVQVDAVVTKDGKPATGLTADDFEIYEDGKKQTITSFAYISNVTSSNSQPVNKPREKGAVAVPFTPLKRDDPHRTIAFVVDDLGLSFESIHQVRRQLRKFIAEELQPNDLVAIIRTGGEMGALQQFSNDSRVLNRAVDQLRWNFCSRVGIDIFRPIGSPSSVGRCGRTAFGNTVRSLQFILDSMGRLPGRKSLVLMSDHLPRESQDEIFTERGPMKEGDLDQEDFEQDDFQSTGFSDNHTQLLNKLAERAIRASVVIYSVDTQGLAITGITAADSFRGDYRAVTQQMQSVLSQRSMMLQIRREGGELLARQTGGFQVRNSNDFQLDRIVDDQSGYYLLGYRPTDETFNRRFHHIKAKIKRSGMSVRTRFGFFGMSDEDRDARRKELTPLDMTNLALTSPFAPQDIEVDMTSFFSDNPGGSVVRSFVYLRLQDLAFSNVNGKQQASIEVYGVIFGDNGSVAEQIKRGATLHFSESEYQEALREGFGFSVDMAVKRPGSYQVRVAIRDRASGKLGSAGEFVGVPNLKNNKLAASGIVLGTAPETSAQSDAAAQAMANPGYRRFHANSDLYFAYRLYNATINRGPQLRNLVMEAKLFRDGKNVYSGPEVPIVADGRPDPALLVAKGVVRLAPDLEPGSYYLQIVITEKGTKSKVAPVIQWAGFELVK